MKGRAIVRFAPVCLCLCLLSGIATRNVDTADATAAATAALSQTRLVVGAFNIQVFGQSKMGKPDVPETLVRIIRQYDLIAVQEIRDLSMTSPHALLDLVNTGLGATETYALLLSDRYGSTSSKEAYGFYYRQALVAATSHGKAEGTFPERPPYVVQWRTTWSQFAFTTIVMHVDPDNVVQELDALGKVAARLVASRGDVIVLGDFNADCSYLGKTAWACIRNPTCNGTSIALWDGVLFGNRNWLIGDDADTTIAASSCAYDRLVVSDQLLPRVVPAASYVHRFDTQLKLTLDFTRLVSDHYPIVLTLNVSNSSLRGNATGYYFSGLQPDATNNDVHGTRALSSGPSLLVPGDLALTAFHSDNIDGKDFFTLVLLRAVGAGTQFVVTDDGWSCKTEHTPGKFRGGEGAMSWRADRNYAAGTVIAYPATNGTGVWSSERGSLALSASGDQLYVYQKQQAATAFLFAASSSGGGSGGNAGWATGVVTSTTTGCLPSTLELINMSFAPTAHADNFVYTGPRNGTRQQLLALILGPANWRVSSSPLDVAALSPQTSFAVATTAAATATVTPTPTAVPTIAALATAVASTATGTSSTAELAQQMTLCLLGDICFVKHACLVEDMIIPVDVLSRITIPAGTVTRWAFWPCSLKDSTAFSASEYVVSGGLSNLDTSTLGTSYGACSVMFSTAKAMCGFSVGGVCLSGTCGV